MVDEVEEPVVCPVDVLEHEHERPSVRHRLKEPPPRRERLALPVCAPLGVGVHAGERSQMRLDPLRFGRIREEAANRAFQLALDFFHRIGL